MYYIDRGLRKINDKTIPCNENDIIFGLKGFSNNTEHE